MNNIEIVIDNTKDEEIVIVDGDNNVTGYSNRKEMV